MRVLITRPEPEASELASALKALGHSAFVEPMLTIEIDPGPQIDTAGVQALVFTSANGARAAARRIRDRAIPVITVGPASAETARELGFTTISQSPGNGVPDLVNHIRATLKPGNGKLLHLSSSHVAGDLAGSLSALGYEVKSEQAYRAETAASISAALQAQLRQGQISAAMFFSPRTAATFAELATRAELAGACENLTALALSHNVAKSLKPLTFRKLLVAQNATVGGMLELLNAL